MDHLEGGFVIHRAPAILSGLNRHTLDLEGRPVSDFDLEATNRLQATPWAVNRRVLGVARQLLVDDVQTPLVPGNARLQVPGRMDDGVWERMDADARKKHRATIARAHGENASRAGRRAGYLDAVDTATDMEAYPRFWFPWTHDFRLRRYPVACGGLSPQGSDLAKNLMHFAVGKPLGDVGFYWLCVRLANAMGQDKLPLDARFAWADQFMAAMGRAIADDPVDCVHLWQDADSPWEALATVLELAEAWDNPHGFVSHLPIPQDGSCNGLQHLSAMGLDPIGALATNLCAVPERHDVYLKVAEHAARRVETDAAKGLPVALLWHGKVGRDSVKRAVLATPYGVTDEGIRRQLVEDKRVPFSDDVSQRDASAYFRDVLVDALAGTVVSAKQIMAWLQTAAYSLAQAGVPMTWTTPTGSTIQQAYRVQSARRVQTLVGELKLLESAEGAALDARKQALGSAPQVVHSFDASHLASTVNVLGREYGLSDFAMVHDSFAVHACDTPRMSAVLRSTFVEQYTPNRLEILAEGFRASAPHVDIPNPPARGTFDLAANVPGAKFFFA